MGNPFVSFMAQSVLYIGFVPTLVLIGFGSYYITKLVFKIAGMDGEA